MLVQQIFTNFLAIDFLSFDKINNLESFCYDKIISEATDPGQSDISDFELKTFLSSITDQIEQRLESLQKEFGLKSQHKFRISYAWLNLNQNNNITAPHLHRNSIISGVLYIKCQDSGQLVLINPNVSHQYVVDPSIIETFNGFNSAVYRIIPEKGKLIMFPSWIMHYVESNANKNDRISMAFNIELVNDN